METDPIEQELEKAIRAFARGVVRDSEDHRLKREETISDEAKAKTPDRGTGSASPSLGWEQG